MKFGRTEMISAGFLVTLMLVVGSLAIWQAAHKTRAEMQVFTGVDRTPRALVVDGPLKFAVEHVSATTAKSALDNPVARPVAEALGYHSGLALAQVRKDFEAFARVGDALIGLERPLYSQHQTTLHPHAADLLASAESVFNEAYKRSGAALEMDEALGRAFLDFENTLRNDPDVEHVRDLYTTLVQRYDLALNRSDAVLHRYTAEHTQAVMQALHADIRNSSRHTQDILVDLDEVYSDLLRQYNNERGHARGFRELSSHLQNVRQNLRQGNVVDDQSLEALVQELDMFFSSEPLQN